MHMENPWMPENGFSADQIKHLHKIFHKLLLTQGNSYQVASIDSKEGGSYKLKNNDEQCFQ